MIDKATVERFMALFQGLDIAFGTGRGEWVKRAPRFEDWRKHLDGVGAGMGIAPLRPDNTVMFAAIDLDEPDFDAAREMQTYIPGVTWLERSRSGNAHVWTFFREPLEAWVAMGVLKEATLAAGKNHVEVFPKNHDFSKVKLGNYINLPFHGDQRPILEFVDLQEDEPMLWEAAGRDGAVGFFNVPEWEDSEGPPHGVMLSDSTGLAPVSLQRFLIEAEEARNSAEDWRKKARWMLISPPESREKTQEFGEQRNLHICAEHIISGDAGPVTEGHRSVVYFSLAKQLTNWEAVDHDEVVEIMRSVNADAGRDSIPDDELLRIIGNAERGQFTSTGCDDPLFQPFAHPDCPIANPRR